MLGVAQDVAHDASTKVAQSLVLRARTSSRAETFSWQLLTIYVETRRTYRAVFSEPKVVLPPNTLGATSSQPGAVETQFEEHRPIKMEESTTPKPPENGKKRTLEESPLKSSGSQEQVKKEDGAIGEAGARKKKKNKPS